MNEGAGDAAGAGVEVFVTAPHSKVCIICMKRQGNIAYCMREIKPNIGADLMGSRCNGIQIKELACIVLYSAKRVWDGSSWWSLICDSTAY